MANEFIKIIGKLAKYSLFIVAIAQISMLINVFFLVEKVHEQGEIGLFILSSILSLAYFYFYLLGTFLLCVLFVILIFYGLLKSKNLLSVVKRHFFFQRLKRKSSLLKGAIIGFLIGFSVIPAGSFAFNTVHIISKILEGVFGGTVWLCPNLELPSTPCSPYEYIPLTFLWLPLVNFYLLDQYTFWVPVMPLAIGAITGFLISRKIK